MGGRESAIRRRITILAGLSLGALVLAALPLRSGDAAGLRWLKVNLHAHAARWEVGDDGGETATEVHRRYAAAGYDLSVHSPHSDYAAGVADADERWVRQLALEQALSSGTSRATLGQELSVEKGPRWRAGYNYIVKRYPGNNDHLGAFAHLAFVPHALPLKSSAEWTHLEGGAVIVNHPGPGPNMWEPGYWDRPGLRDKVDGIEVYNGEGLRRVGYFGFCAFEGVYLRAVSYAGYALRVAVTGGADSHGPFIPRETGTWVLASGNDPGAVAEAVRARRTVAVTGEGFKDVRILQADHLGEVVRSGDVDLAIEIDRPGIITLWREGRPVQRWGSLFRKATRARYQERIAQNAAYAWTVVGDLMGKDRLMTSAAWYEPVPVHGPDLAVDAADLRVQGASVEVVVRNLGDADARDVDVVFYRDAPPYDGGRLVATVRAGDVPAGGSLTVSTPWPGTPRGVYVKTDPESFDLDTDDDALWESDERNNAAWRVFP